jgi:hypothetical protein
MADEGWAEAARELEEAESRFLEAESVFRRLAEHEELSATTTVEIERDLQSIRPRLRSIKSTIAAHTVAEPPTPVVCEVCGRTAGDDAIGWRVYLMSGEPRGLAAHCSECAKR